MKKILIILSIVISILVINKKDDVVIPYDSIRLRVIANSNSKEDQELKGKVSIKLIEVLNNLLDNTNTQKDAYNKLYNNYEELNEIVSKYTNDFSISIGKNYFPNKSYKGVKYNSGYYDSIVVNLGASKGINWWCVVYPPLCLIDETKDYEYTTIVKEILDNYNN